MNVVADEQNILRFRHNTVTAIGVQYRRIVQSNVTRITFVVQLSGDKVPFTGDTE